MRNGAGGYQLGNRSCRPTAVRAPRARCNRWL